MRLAIGASLASLAIILLVIEQPDLIIAKKEDNNGLVQLAQKEFSVFLQHTAESAGKVSNVEFQTQVPILDLKFDHFFFTFSFIYHSERHQDP